MCGTHPSRWRRRWSEALLLGGVLVFRVAAATGPGDDARRAPARAAEHSTTGPQLPPLPLATPAPPDLGGPARVLRAVHPEVDAERLIRFFQEYDSLALDDLPRGAALDSAPGRAAVGQLVERFLDFERVRTQSPDEYQRLVRIEKMESDCRRLGRRIQACQKLLRESPADFRSLQADLTVAEAELRSLLTRLFVARQQNQQIEVNRLEAEVRELNRLLKQRDANRQLIIQQRFLDLTGGQGREEPRPAADGVVAGRGKPPLPAAVTEW